MDPSILLFALAFLLSIALERLLEILKAGYDYIEARIDFSAFWQRRAQRLNLELLHHRKTQEGDRPELHVSELAGETAGHQQAQLIDANRLRRASIRFLSKLVAIGLASVAAFYFQLDILQILSIQLADPGTTVDYTPHWYGMLAAGFAIALGTGPLHKIISTMEKVRKSRDERRQMQAQLQAAQEEERRHA